MDWILLRKLVLLEHLGCSKQTIKSVKKRLTGNLYAPPVGLQLVRNSTLSVPLPIPLKLKACLSVPVNWKVYVCPPDFVLDHDWLAIPKVTTVCRVSLSFFRPCFRNMLFQTYHIKCPQFQLDIDVNVFWNPLPGERSFWSAWLEWIQMHWS